MWPRIAGFKTDDSINEDHGAVSRAGKDGATLGFRMVGATSMVLLGNLSIALNLDLHRPLLALRQATASRARSTSGIRY